MLLLFFLLILRPPTSPLFPYTTLFRSSVGVAPAVLETLEFPAALERVAAHAVGPLGAARVRQRVPAVDPETDRKSTRLNSSHVAISYAVFCLKKKKTYINEYQYFKPYQ